MNQKISLHWDEEGDFLELRFGTPTPSYYKDLGEDTFERRDEETGKIKGYAFFNFIKKGKKIPQDFVVDMPISSSSELS